MAQHSASGQMRHASSLCSPETRTGFADTNPIANRQSKTASLPFDRARRLRRDVVDDAVNAFHFIDDPIGDAGE
jgi:hypothetical protein